MKLYPLAPDAEEVARHFERMARGELPDAWRRQVGYGFVGSRLRLGGHTRMTMGKSVGAEKNPGALIKQVTPVEVGVQQAMSELAARELAAAAGTALVRTKKRKVGTEAKRRTRKETSILKSRAVHGVVHSVGGKQSGSRSVQKKKKKTSNGRKKILIPDNFSL